MLPDHKPELRISTSELAFCTLRHFRAENQEDVTALDEIDGVSAAPEDDASKDNDTDKILTSGDAIEVPEGDLLATTTPSPTIAASTKNDAKEEEKATDGPDSDLKVDLSEFETLESSNAQLTSNVAILVGEFEKPAEEEEDDFDAAFDALAQESVTKYKLEELEKQFENEDDIFDTTNADKVLKLASLLDNVDSAPAASKDTSQKEEKGEEINEDMFEDPFDTSAYDHITGQVETELEFESLAHRESTNAGDDDDVGGDDSKPLGDVLQDSGAAAFFAEATPAPVSEGWAAFDDNSSKPKRPPPPRPAPKRPPPPPNSRSNLAPGNAPSVVVKAPSTESIKSWNNSVADNMIRKSKEDALEEEEEEYDPFDTKEFEETKDEETEEIEDPFDTSAVPDDIVKKKEEEDEDDEKVDIPGEILEPTAAGGDQDDDDEDPFSTDFAAKVLPDKGDPFDTSHVKSELGKAESKALEEELLADLEDETKKKEEEEEQLELQEADEDPFDTSIVDKVCRSIAQ